MSDIPAGHSVEWYRVPLKPGRLAELNQRSDVLGLTQSLGYLLVCMLTGAAAVYAALQHHWWWLAAALVLHGNVCAFMINAVHELVHGTVYRTKWLNAIFVHTFAFVGWINHRNFWASHAEHHLHTMHYPYDQENVFPIRYRFIDFLRAATVQPLALRWLIESNWKLGWGHISGPWQHHLLDGHERRHAIFTWSRYLLIGHATVAGISLAYGLWIIPVVVSLTPLYCRGLFWLLNNTQHVGLQESVTDFRLNCRTIIVNPVFRFLYWHMNWHIEHHMYAAVPCYRLGALHREVAHELPDCPRGLVATWYHIIGVMFRQANEPGWAFRPLLPGEHVVPAASQVVSQASTMAALETRKVWQCSICAFIYDEVLGLPNEGIPAGTPWSDIPADWACPDCGVAKVDFTMVEIQRPVRSDQAHPGARQAAAADCDKPVVIIGSGMAACALARELRQLDAQQNIIILTQDDGAVYAKPMLSSALAHSRSVDRLQSRTAQEFAVDVRVTVRTQCVVTHIDRVHKRVQWAGGTQDYRHLVLAVGSDPVRPRLSGSAADQVMAVNSLVDYRRFRDALPSHGRVAIIGGGLIGCEFADDMSAAGYHVTVMDVAAEPLSAFIPPDLGASLRQALAQRGVTWWSQARAQQVDHSDTGFMISTADGRSVEVDVVLSAIGIRPRLDLAKEAELTTARGIIVNDYLATNDPAISALGDCAEIHGRVLPFIQPLAISARALAATLIGKPTVVEFPVMPVVVKTPAYPLVIIRQNYASGIWRVEKTHQGQVARCVDAEGIVQAVVLGGESVVQQLAAIDELTAVMVIRA